MKKKIKIIDLLCLISVGEEVPKKIKYKDDIWVWTGDDYRKDISDIFLFTTQHYIWFTDFINDEVEILNEEDKDIPLIPDDELYDIKYLGNDADDYDKHINYNFKVLKEKINQLVEEFNEYRKGE